jgi:hypothetical protein
MESKTTIPESSEKTENRMKFFRKDIKVNIKKTRRGKRKGAKNFRKQLRFLGVNAAGLLPKLYTVRKIISELQPSVFFVQETKYKDEGRIKLDKNNTIFELVRKSRNGGGLALSCDKLLHPVWVREGDDSVEALFVEISVKNTKIRCFILIIVFYCSPFICYRRRYDIQYDIIYDMQYLIHCFILDM